MSTLLLVEDFESLREILVAELGRRHECHEAETAEEAFALLGRVAFDVVITDVGLPGTGGADFFRRLRAEYPAIPVIVITGGHAGLGGDDFLGMGAFAFLTKPFSVRDLEAKVREAVGAAGN